MKSILLISLLIFSTQIFSKDNSIVVTDSFGQKLGIIHCNGEKAQATTLRIKSALLNKDINDIYTSGEDIVISFESNSSGQDVFKHTEMRVDARFGCRFY